MSVGLDPFQNTWILKAFFTFHTWGNQPITDQNRPQESSEPTYTRLNLILKYENKGFL